MKDELLAVVHDFNSGKISVGEYAAALEDLNKKNIWAHLSDRETEHLNEFFTWYIGMYSVDNPPHSGLFGGIINGLAQVFKSEHKVSLASLKKKSLELENTLRK